MARTPFPVSDLAGARRWLWTYSPFEEWLWKQSRPGDVRLPLEARLVCDAFWVSPAQLVRQLRSDVAGAILPDPAPARELSLLGRRWHSFQFPAQILASRLALSGDLHNGVLLSQQPNKK